jgi:hypothetical protein
MRMWNLLLLATIFIFPLLLAVLLYFRLDRAPRWLAGIVLILAPAVFFLFLAPILLFADVRAAQARGERCGNPAMAAVLFLYAGIALQLVFGLLALGNITARRRRKPAPPTT